MSDRKLAHLIAVLGGAAVIASGLWCMKRVRELQSEIEWEKELRRSERQGRIRAEQRNVDSVSSNSETWPMFPIGYVRSVFAKRLGTPRQPSIVNAAESVIEIVPELHAGMESLEVYSHIWVLFVFNQNTNIQKRKQAKKPFDGLKLLVAPHRPNPVGLSLCRIVRVDKGAITVAGLDCLDGSPVLDIKPYLPIIECVPDATVPDWIYQGVDEDKAMTVEWDSKILNLDTVDEKLKLLVEETLSRDIRSRNQIRIGDALVGKDWEGELRFKGCHVRYTVNKESKMVRILSLVPSS
jgi:tRNA-Thr(GGU) m(6)t(6)A37 methyltransferase TsaA